MPSKLSRASLWTLLAHVAAFAIAVAPIFNGLVPPLPDYLNHLARAYINSEISSNEVLQRFYLSDWSLIPNLVLDAVLYLLTSGLSLYMAAKVAVALTLLTSALACVSLHFALFRQFTVWTVLPVLLFFNGNLSWVFIPYLMGASLALLFFAFWILSQPLPQAVRLSVLVVLSVLLFFAHLVAFGIFCLLLGSYELQRLLAERRFRERQALAQFVMTATVLTLPFLFLVRITPEHGPLVMSYGGLVRKMETLLSPTLQYTPKVDLVLSLLVVIVSVLVLASGRMQFDRRMALPFAMLVLTAVLTPTILLGVDYMDIRVPDVAAAVGRVSCERRAMPYPEPLLLALLLLSMIAVRAWSVQANWSAYDRELREFVAASQKIEVGSRLLTAYGDTRRGKFADNVHAQTAALAVIERQVFWPNLYTGAHVLKPAPGVAHLDAPLTLPAPVQWLLDEQTPARDKAATKPRPIPAYLKNWRQNFDYLVVFLEIDDPSRLPAFLVPVERGSFFSIYRIRAPGQ